MINRIGILSLLSIILLIISLFSIRSNYQKMRIDESKVYIEATIIEAPANCSNISSRGGFCKLKYKDKVFVKRAGNKFCHLVAGKEKVKMLTNKNSDILLFPNEFSFSNIVLAFLLSFFSVFCFFKGLK